MIINKLLKESSNGSHFYYAIYGNHKYYMKIDGITKDHLPIVRLENQPKKYDKNAKHMLRHAKQVIEYVFEDNGYSYRVCFECHLKSRIERLFRKKFIS